MGSWGVTASPPLTATLVIRYAGTGPCHTHLLGCHGAQAWAEGLVSQGTPAPAAMSCQPVPGGRLAATHGQVPLTDPEGDCQITVGPLCPALSVSGVQSHSMPEPWGPGPALSVSGAPALLTTQPPWPAFSFRATSPTKSTAPPASVGLTCSPAVRAPAPTTSAAWTRPSGQRPRACGCAPSASRRCGEGPGQCSVDSTGSKDGRMRISVPSPPGTCRCRWWDSPCPG